MNWRCIFFGHKYGVWYKTFARVPGYPRAGVRAQHRVRWCDRCDCEDRRTI